MDGSGVWKAIIEQNNNIWMVYVVIEYSNQYNPMEQSLTVHTVRNETSAALTDFLEVIEHSCWAAIAEWK